MKYLIIPPNGRICHPTDFSLFRLCLHLRRMGHTVELAYFSNIYCDGSGFFSREMRFDDVQSMLSFIDNSSYDSIVYRGWMQAYGFGGDLCERYPNRVHVIIKDWNYAPEQEYAFIVGETGACDHRGIKTIFSLAKTVLTHFSADEHIVWANEYHVDRHKFKFLPDLCDPERFRDHKVELSEQARLVYAGSVYAANESPIGFNNHRRMLEDAIMLSKRGVSTSFVMPTAHYRNMVETEGKSQIEDFLYEDRFNQNISVVEGSMMDPSVLDGYDYGIFMLSDPHKYPRFLGNAVLSKFSIYLEAGLPILCPTTMWAMSKICAKHNIGVPYLSMSESKSPTAMADYLALKCMSVDYRELVESVKEFREKWTYDAFEVEEMLK